MRAKPMLKTNLTFEEKNQTTDKKENIASQTKNKKNQTENVKWSIFTEAETKIAAGKAAKKAGLKLNEWIDRALRDQATAELSKRSDPPAKPEDLVNDILQKFTDKLQAEQKASQEAQEAAMKEQATQIAQLTETLSSRPQNLKEWVFGKKQS